MNILFNFKWIMYIYTGEDNTDLMDRRTVMKGVGAFSAAAAVAGAASTAMTSPASAARSGKSIILDVDTDGFDEIVPAASKLSGLLGLDQKPGLPCSREPGVRHRRAWEDPDLGGRERRSAGRQRWHR